MRDDAAYPTGIEIGDRQMKDLEDRRIDRDPGHGGLCYLILPEPRQIPEPEPEPAGPDPALIAALAALAGIPGLQELRDRAALDQAASREHRLTLARGRTRRRAAAPAATAAAATASCRRKPSWPPPPAASASA